jgi:hypothetical protein
MPAFSPWPGWLASLRFFQRAPPTSDSPAFLAFAFTGRAIDEIALRFLSWPTRKGWLAGEGAAPACQNGIPHRQTLAHSHPNNTVHRALDMAASLITFLQNPESILGNFTRRTFNHHRRLRSELFFALMLLLVHSLTLRTFSISSCTLSCRLDNSTMHLRRGNAPCNVVGKVCL